MLRRPEPYRAQCSGVLLCPAVREHDRQLQEFELELTSHSRSIGSFSSVSVADRLPKCQKGHVDFTYALAPGILSSISVPPSSSVQIASLPPTSFARSLIPGKP